MGVTVHTSSLADEPTTVDNIGAPSHGYQFPGGALGRRYGPAMSVGGIGSSVSRLVLIRHGRPEVEVGVPPSTWPLAEASFEDVRRLSALLWPVNRHLVVASTEPKAIQTAEALGLGPVRSSGAFDEVGRPWYDDQADHRAATSDYLAGSPVTGWEPLGEAVRRFDEGLRSLSGPGDVVLATHGTVMAAWLGSTGLASDPFAFWAELRLPDGWEVDLAAGHVWRVGTPS